MRSRVRQFSNEVNAGSMADIAFLLLIFFLVATTIVEDKGIVVKLPPWNPELPVKDVSENNVLTVKVNLQNQLLVEGFPAELFDLREQTKYFILNPDRKENLPSSPTRAIISLQNDRGTEYDTYLNVYNELKAAYHELWEERAQQYYNKAYDQLSKQEQKHIRKEVPLVISEAEPSNVVGL